MECNLRINARIIVGTNSDCEAAIHEAITKLSVTYGGLTYRSGYGTWAENGDKHDVTYENIVIEKAHIFEIGCIPSKFDEGTIKAAFTAFADVAQWIHFETSMVNAGHFDVQELASIR